MLHQKIMRILRPRRQLYIINSFSINSHAQIKLCLIFEECRLIFHIKFWDQLFHICRVIIAIFPLFIYAFEHSIWIVKFAWLEFDHPLRITSDSKSDNVTWAAEMRAV